MQEVIQFLKGIGDFFVTIGNFLVDFIGDLVEIVKLTSIVVAELPDYFSWLPAGFVSVLLAIFAIVVIYKIAGREG